jgi:hypothetical protein
LGDDALPDNAPQTPMGLLDWLSRKPAAKPLADSGASGNSSYLGADSDIASGALKLKTYPGVMVRPPGSPEADATASKIKVASAAAANRAEARRNQRNTYRDLLHQVVREAMVRNGMLSASYKFKVLSLDARGLSFLVMMDLPLEFGEQVERLGSIETMIISNAKARHQLQVTAVYWRIAPVPAHEQFKMSVPPRDSLPAPLAPIAPMAASAAPRSSAPAPAPAPVQAPIQAQVPVPPVPVPAPAPPQPARVQAPSPVLADEIAALKQALASGAAPLAAGAASSKAGAITAVMKATQAPEPAPKAKVDKSGNLLLTGFEETEMVDPDEEYPQLGSTQYGDMR